MTSRDRGLDTWLHRRHRSRGRGAAPAAVAFVGDHGVRVAASLAVRGSRRGHRGAANSAYVVVPEALVACASVLEHDAAAPRRRQRPHESAKAPGRRSRRYPAVEDDGALDALPAVALIVERDAALPDAASAPTMRRAALGRRGQRRRRGR